MSNRKNDNNPYSKFSNKDYDFVSKKTNYDKTIISDFFNLILLGEISKLDSFLYNYPYLNKSLNTEEDSPYHVVVESNLSNHKKINLIKYLKSKDFNVNIQNKMGDTPLLIASKQFNIDIINVLLNLNADINISNYLNINPIHYIFKGSIKQCKDLKIQPIIDEPNVKFDRVANSQNYNKARENYKNIRVLLNDKFSDFESYINEVLKSKKFAAEFSEVRQNTLATITNILSEKSINENEKKNELQKKINLASNDMYKKVLILSDPQIFDPIDFTPSFKTNNNGLKLPGNDEYYIDSRPTFSKYLEEINKKIEEDDEEFKNISNMIESYNIKENVKKVIDNKITFDFTKNILQNLVNLETALLNLIGFNNFGELTGGDMQPSLTDLVPSEIKGLEPIILLIPEVNDINSLNAKLLKIETKSENDPLQYNLTTDINGDKMQTIKNIIITLKDENKLEIKFQYFDKFEKKRNENNMKIIDLEKQLKQNPGNTPLQNELSALKQNENLTNPSKFDTGYYKIYLSDNGNEQDFNFDIKNEENYFKKITDENVENFDKLNTDFLQIGGLPDDINTNLELLRSKFAQFRDLNPLLESYFEKVRSTKIDMNNITVTKNTRNINNILDNVKNRFLNKLAIITIDNTNKSNELIDIHDGYISKLKILSTIENKTGVNMVKNNLDFLVIDEGTQYDVDNAKENYRKLYPEEFDDFFYKFRYSIIEVFLEDNNRNNAFPNELVDNVKKMISELVDLDETILEPTVYSIICDYYDHILINELKNKFNEIIKSKFKQELKNIEFSGDINLKNFSNSDLVDLDVNFGLDISKSENEIYNFVNKKLEKFDEKLISFGQILTANKRNVVFDTDDKGTTQIFYPQDFLVSIKSPTMCTSYNEDLLDKVLKLNTDFNFRDIYGNNILFYAINSQNYLAIQKIKNKLENDDFDRLLNSRNNNKETPIEFCEKKLDILKNYFDDDDLNILGKISSFYENDLKNNMEDIDIHRNVLKNYELIPFIPLYLLHMNTITPINTPTTLNIEYEYLPTPISTPIEKSLNESKKLMEKYKLLKLKSEEIPFFVDSGKTKFKNIISKSSLGRKTKENEMLNNEFKIVCFTIDHILGKSLLNVLKRLTYTFFKFKYPSSNMDDDYVKSIKDRLEDKFKKIESYITIDTNFDFDIYEPSEYTKRIVSIHGDYKLNEYTDDSEVDIFNYIIELIKEEGEKIEGNEPIMEHLTRVIRPYFFKYYNIAVKTIQNCISGYENYISNYIILNEIINLLKN